MSAPAFESREHRRLFAEYLLTRQIPGKFMYAGSGVDRHEQLAADHPEDYDRGRVAEEISALVDAPIENLPSYVCDIGSSNGVHTLQFLALYAEFAPQVRLLGLDFSAQMLEMAKARLRGCEIDCQFTVWDVELGPTILLDRWRTGEPLLSCLLGNTLGNVADPHQVLENVAASMRTGDLLLVSLYLQTADSAKSAVDYYRQVDISNLIIEPFLAAGLDADEIRLDLSWENDAVVGEVELLTAKRLLDVDLSPGERIRCFLSRRHDIASVDSLLAGTGWTLVHRVSQGDRGVLVARRI